jgi:phosphoribosyl 1,2-cyclic phosphate phosphodiesterase
VLVEARATRVLIDTSPDLRAQLLDAGVRHLDGVIWTHGHADHLHGIDELRGINRAMNAPLPVWADAETLSIIRQRFGYVFEPLDHSLANYYKPVLEPTVIEGPFAVGQLSVVPFQQHHGFSETLGLRFGAFAYSTDVVQLDEAAFAALAGIDVWVVDCFRIAPGHLTHSWLERTLSWIERVRPRRAILTHMGEDLDYQTLRQTLPPGVEPGYDGMEIDVPDQPVRAILNG